MKRIVTTMALLGLLSGSALADGDWDHHYDHQPRYDRHYRRDWDNYGPPMPPPYYYGPRYYRPPYYNYGWGPYGYPPPPPPPYYFYPGAYHDNHVRERTLDTLHHVFGIVQDWVR